VVNKLIFKSASQIIYSGGMRERKKWKVCLCFLIVVSMLAAMSALAFASSKDLPGWNRQLLNEYGVTNSEITALGSNALIVQSVIEAGKI